VAEELHGCLPITGFMKKTRLKFSSAIYLIAFRRYSKASYWEIDLTERTVICNCTKGELQFACTDFKAEILPLTEKTQPLEMAVAPPELAFGANVKAI
jgi:hypothetical protein